MPQRKGQRIYGRASAGASQADGTYGADAAEEIVGEGRAILCGAGWNEGQAKGVSWLEEERSSLGAAAEVEVGSSAGRGIVFVPIPME